MCSGAARWRRSLSSLQHLPRCLRRSWPCKADRSPPPGPGAAPHIMMTSWIWMDMDGYGWIWNFMEFHVHVIHVMSIYIPCCKYSYTWPFRHVQTRIFMMDYTLLHRMYHWHSCVLHQVLYDDTNVYFLLTPWVSRLSFTSIFFTSLPRCFLQVLGRFSALRCTPRLGRWPKVDAPWALVKDAE